MGVVEHCGATCGGGEEESAENKESTTSLVVIVQEAIAPLIILQGTLQLDIL